MIHADTPNAKVRIENYAHGCLCAWTSVGTIAESGKVFTDRLRDRETSARQHSTRSGSVS